MDLSDKKETKDKIVFSETRIKIKQIVQKLYHYIYFLPTDLLVDAALQHMFIGFKFDNKTHCQCKCPISNWS